MNECPHKSVSPEIERHDNGMNETHYICDDCGLVVDCSCREKDVFDLWDEVGADESALELLRD